MKKDFKPDYKVHPIETIKESCLYLMFGERMARDFEKGITEENVKYLVAMFNVPKKFWLNLQKNYEMD